MENFLTFATAQWPLLLALLFTLLMLGHNLFGARLKGYEVIGPQEAIRLMSHQEGVVVDVREMGELDRDGQVRDAIHIPLGQLAKRTTELERYRNQPLIAICRSGHRSAAACSRLRKAGFERVFNLQGGINAWKNAGLPTRGGKKK
jgi:rhodanese-related sulfurtransferase